MRNFAARIKKGPAVYFISAPTRDHMPIFELPPLAKQAAIQLGRASADINSPVAGYIVMPSAMMGIVAFKGDHDLGEFVFNYKRLSALAIIGLDHGLFHERLYRKGKFRPWMGRFDQIVIGSNEQLLARLEYMHNEPVRRGLAESPIEYPYSSAADWAGTRQGLIKIEKELTWAGI